MPFMQSLKAAVLAAIMSLMSPIAFAQNSELGDPAQLAIAAILEAGSTAPVQFTAEFTNAVSLEEVDQVIAQVSEQIGEPTSITLHGDGYEVRGETHKIQVRISLNADGAVSGLFFAPPVPISVSLDETGAALTALEGENSLLVTKNGEDLLAENAEASLAIGSAFKLGILAVLTEQIEAGEIVWDQVVTLERQHKSLPTGDLRKFPDGSPVTVHTAASLMISQSDNTATDLLLDTVGRDAVSEKLGQVVLSTRELFQLKGNDALRAEFLAAEAAGKLGVLEALADAAPPDANVASAQFTHGLEWYLTARQLCDLIAPLSGLDVFSINPGIANFADWAEVAFKGGSETGVVNLTTHLTDDAGNEYCVVYTLNRDQAVDEQAVFGAYAAVLSSLKEAGGA